MVMRVSNVAIPSAFIYLGIFHYVAIWVKKNVNFKRNSVENPGFFIIKARYQKKLDISDLQRLLLVIIGHDLNVQNM